VRLGVRKTVIEIDGPVYKNNLEFDQFRDSEMLNLGLHILRIKNEELLEYRRNWIMCTPLFTK
jgi:very-short-patch-repair endonuclease